ncbi:MAG: hypothetical protein K8S54_08820 [Spirochaetia bacterium]|nr:hypothetical protein [Spirochaetia bacterium]
MIRALIFGAALLIVLGNCRDFDDGFERGFKQSFQKRFLMTCKDAAVRKGAKPEKAESYCSCTARQIAEKHSAAEIKKIMATEQNPELDAAVKSCLK